MKCRSFYYVLSDFEKNEIFSCGATFTEFIENISSKPKNILLLDSQFGCAKYHNGICLDYVDSENMEEFLNDDVYSYGNFVWADYSDISSIDNLKPEELAELLYISHCFRPMHTPWLKSINNDYLYFAHDDDYWTKIFMKDVQNYKNVLHAKILSALKGRKKHIEPLPEEILNYIFENSKDGILMDFENSIFYNRTAGVRMYKLGPNYNYDKIYDVYKRRGNFTKTCMYLEYNGKTKKWNMFSQWK